MLAGFISYIYSLMFKIDSGFVNFKEGNAVIKVCVPLLIILEIITIRAIHFSLSLSQAKN